MKQLLKKTSFLALLLLASVISVRAEQTLVRGKVYSAVDNETLIGVAIVEYNKDDRITASAITNYDGEFSIKVTSMENRLVFTYMGFKKLSVQLQEGNTDLKIVMEENVTELSEAVVTATNRQVGSLSIAERDVSMAVSHLDAADIEDMHVASIDEAIQGRMAGVDVVATSGDPGSGMSIQIRGTTSINGNNQPLIVVDGMPLETEIGADFDFSTASEEEFSQLLNIAPADIKDIVVLKDAAANAIWGAKAANGVLQITTQRGSISDPQITVRATTTYKPKTENLPTLTGDEYTSMILEAHFNAGTILDPLLYPQFSYDPNNPEYYYNYSANTDWIDAVSQNAWAQEYNMSVRGGSAKTQYSFSLGYYDDIGNTVETEFQRLTTRLNLDYNVSQHLKFRADISYTHSNKLANYELSGNNVRSQAYNKMPNQTIYYIDEYGQQTSQYYMPMDNPQGTYPKVYNPVAMAYDGLDRTLSESIIPKLSLQYRPNDTWRYTVDVGFQVSTNKNKSFLPQSATGLVWSDSRTNTANDSDNESFTIQTFNKLYYTPTFEDSEKHRLIGLLGLNTYERSSYSYSGSTTNLASTELQDPSIPSRLYQSGNLNSSSGGQRSVQAYMNLNYTFLDRYTIYGNVNMEGNSRFGQNYRFGVFPSISGRYRISGEPFMQGIGWLDDLSLRASYGMSGNAPSRDYLYFNNYSTYDYGYLGKSAAYPSSLELKDLRWEHNYVSNIGFNFVAFQNKLNVEGELYTRKVDDQFMNSLSIPSTSGFTSMTTNYGTILNKGFELNVNYTAVRTKDLLVKFAFNIARSENSVTKISEYAELYSGNWSSNGSYLSRVELNQPTGSIYGYLYDGVYLNEDQTIARDKHGNKVYTMDADGQKVPVYMTFGYPSISYQFQPGDARYKDLNNDGNINYQDIVWLGDINPLFFGGLTPSVKWKQWSLNTVFFFRYGNSVINQTRMNLESMYNYNNQSRSVLKRWRHSYESEEDAPEGLLPRALYGTGYNWLASDRYVEDGSFLRWKSLTLRYNFARELIKPLGLSSAYIYTTLNNIHVWTNYTGQDPECSSSTGKDTSRAPVAKSYTLGLNVSF